MPVFLDGPPGDEEIVSKTRYDAFLRLQDDPLDTQTVITHEDWPVVVEAARRALHVLEGQA